ncbi:MAG: hypothetical protein KDB53_04130, partial [Planctomycetes bacterium]|nr:hypothetical protein [Planctomycetota bacterium]
MPLRLRLTLCLILALGACAGPANIPDDTESDPTAVSPADAPAPLTAHAETLPLRPAAARISSLRKGSAEFCRNHLRELTAAPRPAGSRQGERDADYLAAQLKSFGYQVRFH